MASRHFLDAAFFQLDDQLTADLCLEAAFLEAAMEAAFACQLEVYFLHLEAF